MMSSRAKRILDMATKNDHNASQLKVTSNLKKPRLSETVAVSNNDVLIVKGSAVNEFKFFEPIFPKLNETKSIFTSGITDFGGVVSVQSMDQFYESNKILPGTSNSANPSTSSGMKCNKNFEFSLSDSSSSSDVFHNSDDSDADPNYNPESPNYDPDSPNSENMDELGSILERNLESEEEGTATPTTCQGTASAIQLDSTVNEEQRIRTNRKQRTVKRNLGKSYQTKTGKQVLEREWKELGECKKKCRDKISSELQESIFREYWRLGEYSQRVAFMSGLITVADKKSQVVRKGCAPLKNRRFSCHYHVYTHGEKREVCKGCLLYIFGETNKFVNTIVNKKFSTPGTVITPELRGKATPPNKLSQEKVDEIVAHIYQFPIYESHYTRRDTSKKYLHSDLNLTKMYTLYTEITTNPVSLVKYSQIFKTLNIRFKKPKVDTCHSCDVYKMKIQISDGEEKIKLIEEQTAHHNAADSAYKSKANDKVICESDNTKCIFNFDLQQCLPTPLLNTSVSFYKRLLWTYNLTVFDCVTNTPFCFKWNEAVAKRGGNDIASCLYSHLLALPSTVKSVVFFSDNCPGQNKNSFVAAMFLTFLQSSTTVEVIEHKFLEVGHTHMECDTAHALIEKRKKNTNTKIHHPRDWLMFVENIRAKNKFKVIEMTAANFFNFEEVAKSKFTWRNKSENGIAFSWRSVKWIRYTKDASFIEFKLSLETEIPFEKLNLRKRGVSSFRYELNNCYDAPPTINLNKKKDLLTLLPLIDPLFHPFYQSLKTEESADIHPDLLDTDEE